MLELQLGRVQINVHMKFGEKVKFEVTNGWATHGFPWVFHGKFPCICNIKAAKRRFLHMTLKKRSKVKFEVTNGWATHWFL